MVSEREQKPNPILLPRVTRRTVSDLDNRWAPLSCEYQDKARTENPSLFLFLRGLNLLSFGGCLVYIQLDREAKVQGRNLPCVSRETIEEYKLKIVRQLDLAKTSITPKELLEHAMEIAERDESTLLLGENLIRENPELMGYLEWMLEIFQTSGGVTDREITRLRLSALLTYELLRKQAEKDVLQLL